MDMSILSYVVNFDEFAATITNNSNENLQGIIELLEDLKQGLLIPDGMQKAKGLTLSVPAVSEEYTLTFIPDTDILLTGITYSQSAWKYEDNWDLEIEGVTMLFESIYTKELGEHKKFEKYYPVPAGTPINLILHNKSGNSRQVWADLEYIGLIGTNTDTIPHEYDWKVELQWEEGTTDLDLQVYLDENNSKYVQYNRKEYVENAENHMWLDYDYTNHTNATEPEIVTIKGFAGSTAQVQVNNYNHHPLTQNAVVNIYKGEEQKETYTIAPEMLGNESTSIVAVCDIDITKEMVTKIMENIPSVGF